MLNRFLTTYQSLNKDNLAQLTNIYAQDIVFIDPAHEIRGLVVLTAYFTKLYQHIDSITFDYEDTLSAENSASIYWTMTFSHPKIGGGKPIITHGNTLIRFDADGKVNYHRDYFDLGEMLYEHLPLLGAGVRYVKKQLAKVD